MNITPNWNYHIDIMSDEILALERIAYMAVDKKQREALLKTIERLRMRLDDSRLSSEECPTCKGVSPEFCSNGFHAP